ncbi:MAG: hypothetical protein EZS28_006677, partial [Streblomastix strix]
TPSTSPSPSSSQYPTPLLYRYHPGYYSQRLGKLRLRISHSRILSPLLSLPSLGRSLFQFIRAKQQIERGIEGKDGLRRRAIGAGRVKLEEEREEYEKKENQKQNNNNNGIQENEQENVQENGVQLNIENLGNDVIIQEYGNKQQQDDLSLLVLHDYTINQQRIDQQNNNDFSNPPSQSEQSIQINRLVVDPLFLDQLYLYNGQWISQIEGMKQSESDEQRNVAIQNVNQYFDRRDQEADEWKQKREKNKPILLNRIFLANTSTTLTIYPSFARPLFFEDYTKERIPGQRQRKNKNKRLNNEDQLMGRDWNGGIEQEQEYSGYDDDDEYGYEDEYDQQDEQEQNIDDQDDEYISQNESDQSIIEDNEDDSLDEVYPSHSIFTIIEKREKEREKERRRRAAQRAILIQEGKIKDQNNVHVRRRKMKQYQNEIIVDDKELFVLTLQEGEYFHKLLTNRINGDSNKRRGYIYDHVEQDDDIDIDQQAAQIRANKVQQQQHPSFCPATKPISISAAPPIAQQQYELNDGLPKIPVIDSNTQLFSSATCFVPSSSPFYSSECFQPNDPFNNKGVQTQSPFLQYPPIQPSSSTSSSVQQLELLQQAQQVLQTSPTPSLPIPQQIGQTQSSQQIIEQNKRMIQQRRSRSQSPSTNIDGGLNKALGPKRSNAISFAIALYNDCKGASLFETWIITAVPLPLLTLPPPIPTSHQIPHPLINNSFELPPNPRLQKNQPIQTLPSIIPIPLPISQQQEQMKRKKKSNNNNEDSDSMAIVLSTHYEQQQREQSIGGGRRAQKNVDGSINRSQNGILLRDGRYRTSRQSPYLSASFLLSILQQIILIRPQLGGFINLRDYFSKQQLITTAGWGDLVGSIQQQQSIHVTFAQKAKQNQPLLITTRKRPQPLLHSSPLSHAFAVINKNNTNNKTQTLSQSTSSPYFDISQSQIPSSIQSVPIDFQLQCFLPGHHSSILSLVQEDESQILFGSGQQNKVDDLYYYSQRTRTFVLPPPLPLLHRMWIMHTFAPDLTSSNQKKQVLGKKDDKQTLKIKQSNINNNSIVRKFELHIPIGTNTEQSPQIPSEIPDNYNQYIGGEYQSPKLPDSLSTTAVFVQFPFNTPFKDDTNFFLSTDRPDIILFPSTTITIPGLTSIEAERKTKPNIITINPKSPSKPQIRSKTKKDSKSKVTTEERQVPEASSHITLIVPNGGRSPHAYSVKVFISSIQLPFTQGPFSSFQTNNENEDDNFGIPVTKPGGTGQAKKLEAQVKGGTTFCVVNEIVVVFVEETLEEGAFLKEVI